MIYQEMQRGIFLSRPNRFLADVILGNESGENKPQQKISQVSVTGGASQEEREQAEKCQETVVRCHVKNTGRLKELLIPGTPVWVEHCEKPERKTKYSLIAVEKTLPDGSVTIVNIDSQSPNKAAAQWIKDGADGIFWDILEVKREKRYGDSRFDLWFRTDEKEWFLEVKGVTLDLDGIACFPDAPTERGVKHVEELCHAKAAGYGAAILFVIQMKGIHGFRPNDKTHPAFGEALRTAAGKGVKILAYDCLVTADSMVIDKPIPVLL